METSKWIHPELNRFDNEITSYHKAAHTAELPLRLVAQWQGFWITIFSFVRWETDWQHLTMSDLERVLAVFPQANQEDIAIVLFRLSMDVDLEADVIVNMINRIYSLAGWLRRFGTLHDLDVLHNSWSKQLIDRRTIELQTLAIVNSVQKRMLELEALEKKSQKILFAPYRITSLISIYEAFHADETPVTAEDGIDIFNNAIATEWVPFIRYNGGEGSLRGPYYKLYRGKTIEDQPNYESVIMKNEKMAADNTIYMTLWLGNPLETHEFSIANASQDSLYRVIFDLTKNSITIETPVYQQNNADDVDLGMMRISRTLPGLTFKVSAYQRVRAEMDIYDFKLNRSVLLHLMLLETHFAQYLFVNENTDPSCIKKQLDIQYRELLGYEKYKHQTMSYITNPYNITLNVSSRRFSSETRVEVWSAGDDRFEELILRPGTSYLHLSMSTERSTDLNDFYLIFRLLLLDYMRQYDRVVDQYPFLPQISETEENAETEVKLNSKKGNIVQLQRLMPQIFQTGYARYECQSKNQPLILETEAEEEYWRARPVDGKPRHILTYPREKGMRFTCPTDRYPYIGLKINGRSNRDRFWYVPCCFQKDHLTNDAVYHDYLEDIPPNYNKVAKAEREIITDKIIDADKLALLPPMLDTFLTKKNPSIEAFRRLGIPKRNNSILHAVAYAVNDAHYMELETEDEKDAYVIRLRRRMAEFSPLLYKQELYDRTDDEIIEILLDVDSFLDPFLVYRGLEELYGGINLFVFSKGRDRRVSTELSMEIPRHQMFCVRPPRSTRTILVLKHYGTESNNLLHPHCELIVATVGDRGLITNFGSEMREALFDMFNRSMKTFTWTDYNGHIVPQYNLYNKSDLTRILFFNGQLGLIPIDQWLDGFGKMRAMTVETVAKRRMTWIFPPAQPLNLPIMSSIRPIDPQILDKILGLHNADGVEMKGSSVGGYWFPLNTIPQSLFVFTQKHAVTRPELKRKANPLEPLIYGYLTDKYQKLQRDANLYLQLLYWLLSIARKKGVHWGEFYERHFSKVYLNIESYDLDELPRQLPKVETVEAGLRHIEFWASTMVRNGLIQLLSSRHASLTRYMLGTFEGAISPTATIPGFLTNYYVYHSNFKAIPHNILLLGDEMKHWMLNYVSEANRSQIRTVLKFEYKNEEAPFLYRSPQEKVYLVQNVEGGSKKRALQVCNTWITARYNPGYTATAYEEELNGGYIVYGIIEKSIMIFEDKRKTGAETGYLLYYGTNISATSNNWAALIKLL